MRIIIIEKEIFDFSKKFSKGIISSLSSLPNNECLIKIDNYIKNENIVLEQILFNEDINLIFEIPGDYNEIYKISLTDNLINVTPGGLFHNLSEVISFIKRKLRSTEHIRKTKETNIRIKIALDGEGKSDIKTGIGFFDHMLEQIARHSNIDIGLFAEGDLHIDEHHTVEDVGITLGDALKKSLGNKIGIKRYGFALPMDDANASCLIDLGGRSYLNFQVKFVREKVGEFPTELVEEFFRGISLGLKCNIHIKAKGKNEHHKIEAIFKAFAKSLNEACRLDERNFNRLPTTKGII